jgi:hypothetical protein
MVADCRGKGRIDSSACYRSTVPADFQAAAMPMLCGGWETGTHGARRHNLSLDWSEADFRGSTAPADADRLIFLPFLRSPRGELSQCWYRPDARCRAISTP